MSISPLALAAKKVIDTAWLNGSAYDLSSQAAYALESAQLLQSPETAAESAHYRAAFEAQRSRAETLDRLLRTAQDRVAELEAALYTEQAHGRTFLEQRDAHAQELLKLRARLDEVHRMPQDNVTPAEVRLGQYSQPPRTFASDAERALFQIACGLRDTLEETRDQRNAARLRVSGLEAAPTTVYRAEHPDSGITLGHYATEAAARAHCEATERRAWPTGTSLIFGWIRDALPEDEENGVAELVVTAGQNEESTTGYIVTALEVPAEYDPDGDE